MKGYHNLETINSCNANPTNLKHLILKSPFKNLSMHECIISVRAEMIMYRRTIEKKALKCKKKCFSNKTNKN